MAKTKTKYYKLKNILSKNAVYNIIFGERSNGKTYSVLEYGIEQYYNSGKQYADFLLDIQSSDTITEVLF